MNKRTKKLVFTLTVTFLVAVLFRLSFFKVDEFFDYELIYIYLVILFLWQGNLVVDKQLNIRYSWISDPQKRLILQLAISTIFTSVILFIAMFVMHQVKFGDGRVINRKMAETFLPALFITLSLMAVIVGSQFYKSLRQSMVEVEKYKAASANAQLQNLKNQLNPHFLFNNLSVLTSLVYKDQGRAVDFINELSKVYRYVLDSKNFELVPLQDEIDFLDHYLYLLKIRFEKSISFDVKIDLNSTSGYLPPMCLQMLVENSVQHNETSQAKPLQVSIYSENNCLVVENLVQPRSDVVESSKTGLTNIESRYSYFTDEKVKIFSDGKIFRVSLPLIGIK